MYHFLSRNVCYVLKEVIFFVAESDSSHHNVDPLDFVVAEPSRDRQKLLREQFLLDNVFEILKVTYKKNYDLFNLEINFSLWTIIRHRWKKSRALYSPTLKMRTELCNLNGSILLDCVTECYI